MVDISVPLDRLDTFDNLTTDVTLLDEARIFARLSEVSPEERRKAHTSPLNPLPLFESEGLSDIVRAKGLWLFFSVAASVLSVSSSVVSKHYEYWLKAESHFSC